MYAMCSALFDLGVAPRQIQAIANAEGLVDEVRKLRLYALL
jgi:hypothetical protein